MAQGLISMADQDGLFVAGEIHGNTSRNFIAPMVKFAQNMPARKG